MMTVDNVHAKVHDFVKLALLQQLVPPGATVCDLYCGHGSDVAKWAQAQIGHYIGIDSIASTLEEAREEWDNHKRPYPADFFELNPSMEDLQSHLRHMGLPADFVCCMGHLQDCFNSEDEVRRLLQNVSSLLKPGGYFFGITADSSTIWSKYQKAVEGALKSGNLRLNSVLPRVKAPHYTIVFEDDRFTPFGTMYTMQLAEGLPPQHQSLVHFPSLIRLAEEVGLEYVEIQNLQEFYDDYRLFFADALRRTCGDLTDTKGRLFSYSYDVLSLYTTFIFKKADQNDNSFMLGTPFLTEEAHLEPIVEEFEPDMVTRANLTQPPSHEMVPLHMKEVGLNMDSQNALRVQSSTDGYETSNMVNHNKSMQENVYNNSYPDMERSRTAWKGSHLSDLHKASSVPINEASTNTMVESGKKANEFEPTNYGQIRGWQAYGYKRKRSLRSVGLHEHVETPRHVPESVDHFYTNEVAPQPPRGGEELQKNASERDRENTHFPTEDGSEKANEKPLSPSSQKVDLEISNEQLNGVTEVLNPISPKDLAITKDPEAQKDHDHPNATERPEAVSLSSTEALDLNSSGSNSCKGGVDLNSSGNGANTSVGRVDLNSSGSEANTSLGRVDLNSSGNGASSSIGKVDLNSGDSAGNSNMGRVDLNSSGSGITSNMERVDLNLSSNSNMGRVDLNSSGTGSGSNSNMGRVGLNQSGSSNNNIGRVDLNPGGSGSNSSVGRVDLNQCGNGSNSNMGRVDLNPSGSGNNSNMARVDLNSGGRDSNSSKGRVDDRYEREPSADRDLGKGSLFSPSTPSEARFEHTRHFPSSESGSPYIHKHYQRRPSSRRKVRPDLHPPLRSARGNSRYWHPPSSNNNSYWGDEDGPRLRGGSFPRSNIPPQQSRQSLPYNTDDIKEYHQNLARLSPSQRGILGPRPALPPRCEQSYGHPKSKHVIPDPPSPPDSSTPFINSEIVASDGKPSDETES